MKPVFILIFICTFACSCAGFPFHSPAYIQKGGIVVYGDTQRSRIHKRVAAKIALTEPAAVFHTGDLVNDGENKEEWDEFNSAIAGLRSTAPFYPAHGNHDKHSSLYFNNFMLPNNELWYSVHLSSMHFVILDSESQLSQGSEQYQWLENELKGSKAACRVVIIHRPMFASSDLSGICEFRRYLTPLFEKHRVSIVFCGHNHNYERLLVNGICYIITGGGGGKLEGRETFNTHSRVFHKKHHFCVMRLNGKYLEVISYSLDLDELDRFQFFIEKAPLRQ